MFFNVYLNHNPIVTQKSNTFNWNNTFCVTFFSKKYLVRYYYVGSAISIFYLKLLKLLSNIVTTTSHLIAQINTLIHISKHFNLK